MAAADHTVSGVAGRYATALFDLANESGALDAVSADLDGILQLLDESPDFQRLVRSPVYSREDQKRAIAAVLGKLGIAGLVAQFVGLVAHNRRLFALRDMIRAFRALLARHRGEITAEVISAEPLSATQKETLTSALKAVLGREARIDERVDQSLLGGLVVRVGSRMIDTSLRTKLNSIRIAMKEVG